MGRVKNFIKGAGNSSAEPTLEDWRYTVAHALLFRVEPDTHAASGTAVCVLEEQDDGSKSARVAGFTSFVQDAYPYNSLRMDDDSARKRLLEGNLSFYGAFRAPEALREEHSIVQRHIELPN
jgi:hypothetical protein